MANAVAVVTESGFGKTTSLGQIPELGIKGLKPEETFLINVKNKPLPFRGWKNKYKPVDISKGPPKEGNYLGSCNPYDIIPLTRFTRGQVEFAATPPPDKVQRGQGEFAATPPPD